MERSLWWLGALLMVGSTVAGALGSILIKSAHLVRQKPRLSWIYWLTGIVVFQAVLNVGLSMAALGFAAQSLLSPLIACQIVFNAVLAPCLLPNERLTWLDLMSTVLIVLGGAMAGYFAPHTDQHYTLHEMLAAFTHMPFLIYAGLSASLMLAAYGSSLLPEQQLDGLLGACRRVGTASLPGFFVGNANIFAKSVSGLVVGAVQKGDWQPFTTPMPWVILIVGPSMAAASLFFLNRALARLSATQVVPTYISTLIVVSTVSGGIYFDEFQHMRLGSAAGLAGGVVLVVAGVGLQAMGKATSAPSHPDSQTREMLTERLESNSETDYDIILNQAAERRRESIEQHRLSVSPMERLDWSTAVDRVPRD